MTDAQKGAAAGALAYFIWGSMPVYWKALSGVASAEILGHRVLWSVLFSCLVLAAAGSLKEAAAFVRTNRKGALWLALGGYLIAFNWGLYIWAINAGRVLDTSLGYYINPLVSMCFGVLFFSEKLRTVQKAAIALAAGGVLIQVVAMRSLPLVSLGLAFSFALYGVLKKKAVIAPPAALFLETLAVAPAALIFLLLLQKNGAAHFPYDLSTNLLLAGTGIVTSVPLFLFASCARRVRLTTLGFIQYISPTMTFITGSLIYQEPMNSAKLLTFICIWAALAIYSVDIIRASKAAEA